MSVTVPIELVNGVHAQLRSRPAVLTINPGDVDLLARHIASCALQWGDVDDIDDIAHQIRRGVVEAHGIPIRVAA